MRDRELACDQVSIVFRIEHRSYDVVAGETLDGLE